MVNLLSPGTGSAGLFGPTGLFSSSGAPVTSTAVTVFQSDGSTVATLYTDQTKTTTVANPVSTDANGNLTFYTSPGEYVLSYSVGGVPTTKTIEVDAWYSDAAWNAVVDTVTASAVAGDCRLANATGGAITETTPAPGLGVRCMFVKTDSSANAVTVSPVSGSILGPSLGTGAATYVLPSQGAYVVLMGDGSNFHVIDASRRDPYFIAYPVSATSMTGSATVAVALANTEASGGAPAITYSLSKFTVPLSGVYHVDYGIGAVSGLAAGVGHNSTTVLSRAANVCTSSGSNSAGSCDLVCAAGDYLTLLGENGGSTTNCSTSQVLTYFQVRYVCPA